MTKEKAKQFFAQDNISKIFCSKAFVWCWLAIVFICWATGGWVAGFIIAAVVAGLILCLCKDTMPVTTILWTFLFMLGINRHKLQGMGGLIAAVAFIIVGAIVNLIRFKPSFRFLSYKKVSVTTVATIVFCLANVLSGIARAERYQNFAEHGLYATVVGILCVVLALGYIFFSATMSGGEDGKRVINHLLYLMFASSVVIVLQLIVYYLRIGGFEAVIDGFIYKSVEIGWGGANNYSIILAMMMPATLYYATHNGKFAPLYLIYAIVQYFFVFMSASRGAILFGALGLITATGMCVCKSEYRGRTVATIVVILCVGVFGFMAYADRINVVMSRIMSKALDGSGRSTLWDDAIKNFKDNPIFGAGFDFNLGGHVSRSDGYTPYWYHSTLFQALGASGIVGFIAWIILEYSRLRAFFTQRSIEKWFLLIGFGIFWLYALIDVFYYTPNGLLYLFMFTIATEKSVEPKKLRPYTFELIERKAMERKCRQEYTRDTTSNAEN